MAKKKTPVYIEEGTIYHADSCIPLVEAAGRGELQLHALARGTYPGTPLQRGELPGLRSIGFWDATHEQNWGLPLHRNEGIELTLLETGSMPFQLQGKVHMLHPGSMTITRPWQPHRLGNPNIGVGRLHWIILDVGVRHPHQDWHWPSWLVLEKSDIRDLTDFLRGNEKPVWDAGNNITRCFKQIADTVSTGDFKRNASRLSVFINELFLHLLEMFQEKKVNVSSALSTARRSTELFLEILESSVERPWTLEAMARDCGLGITRFVHYCREITNLTPMQYLNQLRVRKASEMLLKFPDKSITAIAFDVGFSSSQYFATVFRQYHKCSPRKYRISKEGFL